MDEQTLRFYLGCCVMWLNDKEAEGAANRLNYHPDLNTLIALKEVAVYAEEYNHFSAICALVGSPEDILRQAQEYLTKLGGLRFKVVKDSGLLLVQNRSPETVMAPNLAIARQIVGDVRHTVVFCEDDFKEVRLEVRVFCQVHSLDLDVAGRIVDGYLREEYISPYRHLVWAFLGGLTKDQQNLLVRHERPRGHKTQ